MSLNKRSNLREKKPASIVTAHQVRRVLRALERWFKMILGGSVCESLAVLTAHFHAPIKIVKARAGLYLTL